MFLALLVLVLAPIAAILSAFAIACYRTYCSAAARRSRPHWMLDKNNQVKGCIDG